MAGSFHPEKFGRYALLHRLAVGGTSEIFLAHDPHPSTPHHQILVIKRLQQELGDNREHIMMLLDEERLMSSLSHPNIVRVLDFGKAEGQYFLGLEYVWGASVATLTHLCVQEGFPFYRRAALYLGAQAARALHHAHQHRQPNGEPAPIIHRDVTLGNVAVTYGGQIKILDFGIAKARDRFADTQRGLVKGTLSYVAPEQLSGDPVGAHTDIYQLGVLLYQILVGRDPVSAPNDVDLMEGILQGRLRRPVELVPNFPPVVDEALCQALARDPRDRYYSALEFAQRLEQLMGCTEREAGIELAKLVLKLTGDRHQRQRGFISAVLEGRPVQSDAAELFQWPNEASMPKTIPGRYSSIIDTHQHEPLDAPRLEPTAAEGKDSPDEQTILDLVVEVDEDSDQIITVQERTPRPVSGVFRQVQEEIPPSAEEAGWSGYPTTDPDAESSAEREVVSEVFASPSAGGSTPADVEMSPLFDAAPEDVSGFGSVEFDIDVTGIHSLEELDPFPRSDTIPIESSGDDDRPVHDALPIFDATPRDPSAPEIPIALGPGGRAVGEEALNPWTRPWYQRGFRRWLLYVAGGALVAAAISMGPRWWPQLFTPTEESPGGLLEPMGERDSAGMNPELLGATKTGSELAGSTSTPPTRPDPATPLRPGLAAAPEAAALSNSATAPPAEHRASKVSRWGFLSVNAGVDARVTYREQDVSSESRIALQKRRSTIALTRGALGLSVSLHVTVIDGLIQIRVESDPRTSIKFNGMEVGETPKGTALDTSFRIGVTPPGQDEVWVLRVKYQEPRMTR